MSKSLIIIGSNMTDLYGYDTNKDVSQKYSDLRKSISEYIKQNGITDVYSTLNLGAEQIGAEAAINAKTNFHALIPYPNQDERWPKQKKDNYQKILSLSADQTLISDVFDGSAAKRLDKLSEIVDKNSAEVLMIYNGENEKDNSLYAFNTLTKKCVECGLDKPMFLNPKTMTISKNRPYPDRPAIVSQERIAEINAHNDSKKLNGHYTRQERKDMSDIWEAYLNKLTLRPEHEKDLLNRGFTKEQIEEFQYKSLPQTREEADELVKSLMDDGYDLTKAPGFAIAGDGGAITTQIMNDGYFCPARDTETKMLYGMQIRNCDKEAAKKYGKYTWFSAGKNGIGLSSSQPAAYYEGNMSMNIDGKDHPVILITEGVLKCNLAYLGMGRQVGIVGMAGVYGEKGLYVYNETSQYERIPDEEQRHLFKDAIVVECFDADFVNNKNVRAASYRIRNELIDHYGAYATCRMTWDDDGKGIDDYVVDCNREGKDIHFDLSNVIIQGSPKEFVLNEYNKKELRHVEIHDINDTPLKGLSMNIKMDDIYAAGYKIQPKTNDGTHMDQIRQYPGLTIIDEKNTVEYKNRKHIEHMNERTGRTGRIGRQDEIFREALPARIDSSTKLVPNAGKFIIDMDKYSTLDVDIKERAQEISETVNDYTGADETKDRESNIIVSDPIEHGDKKSVVLLFDGFDVSNVKAKNKNPIEIASCVIKGVIDNMFYKYTDQYAHGRAFPISNTELATAKRKYTGPTSHDIHIQNDMTTPTQTLNDNLAPQSDMDKQKNDDIDFA